MSLRALDPAAVQAERIADLWWWFFWVCAVAYIVVLVAALWAALRRRPAEVRVEDGPTERDPAPDAEPQPIHLVEPFVLSRDPARERRLVRVVGGAAAVTVVGLVGLLVASVATGRSLGRTGEERRTIHVTGYQWWWKVTYPDQSPRNTVTAANELHLPRGLPVRLQLDAADVIHSLWIPRLHGKRDLLPGRTTFLTVEPRESGTFLGLCAEFCGAQHAHMALPVVVEEPRRFERWLAAQTAAAREPGTAAERRGRELFLASTCPMCHTVRGTPANGQTAPDLTHVGSRLTLASGTLPNRRGHLAGWILDPHGPKPGVNMPPHPTLGGSELRDLAAWLRSLK
jgi:cytochrome c oxidase subunit 2